MRLVADLHVHSRWSRATSREADLDGYYRWARVKGISVVGTGDFTHPAWFRELSEKLVEKDGLFELSEAPRGSIAPDVTPADIPVRFLLTAEISSIYKKHGAVRKVHSVVGMPSLDSVARLNAKLASIGNIASDGRPILGLDPKDLLSLILDITEEGFLIPAHVWTPWFSVFGSKSGFDKIEDCFEELTPRIFALETGLSSDPPMNWRWSALDRYRLISNSDAHSPPNLAREANLLDAEPTWSGVVGALRTGRGFLGTLEFYPEEGKYHFDGHRKCGVVMDPEETLRSGGACPVCGKTVTVGVLNRVLALADRPSAVRPALAADYRNIIPLRELIAECVGSGPGSRAVEALYGRAVSTFGNELSLLMDAQVEDIAKGGGPLLAEAIRRMRAGEVSPIPGYDGEFGVIKVFDEAELARLRGQDELFATATPRRRRKERDGVARAAAAAVPARAAADALLSLDAEQAAVIAAPFTRGIVSAGPGSGKTRLLVAWIAREALALPENGSQVLALTFTNKAAAELRERIQSATSDAARRVTAATFHAFAFAALRERYPALVNVLTAADRETLLGALVPTEPPRERRRHAQRMERAWEGAEEPDEELAALMRRYHVEARALGGMDIARLVPALAALLDTEPGFAATVAARYPVVAIDELQDINPAQYALLMRLARPARKVLGIGDPDQAIYGFRGSDRALFFQFRDELAAEAFTLRRSYRSTATIVTTADALMADDRAEGTPPLVPLRPDGAAITVAEMARPDDEARSIASAITELVGGVDAVSVDAVRRRGDSSLGFSDIAVLFRTRAVRDALLPGLLASGLPVSTGTAAPLADEEPFRSLIAALRLVANSSDTLALTVLKEVGAADEVRAELSELGALVGERGTAAALDRAADILRLDRTAPDTALGLEALQASALRHGAELDAFLRDAALCTRETEWSRQAEKIPLLTFHAAKGLEWPVVFIAGAEEGIVPMGDDLAEERRLFYVACTRARDVLYITHCRSRVVFGQERPAAPSRFLAAIPERCRQAPAKSRSTRSRQLSLF